MKIKMTLEIEIPDRRRLTTEALHNDARQLTSAIEDTLWYFSVNGKAGNYGFNPFTTVTATELILENAKGEQHAVFGRDP